LKQERQQPEAVRIDRWLWAARFYKSRTLAARACEGGKVDVNGRRARAHKTVVPGDIVSFRAGDWRRKVKVLRISERRGPSSAARLLYEDMSPPPPRKNDWLIAPPPSRPKGSGRPTKQERRRLRRLRGY